MSDADVPSDGDDAGDKASAGGRSERGHGPAGRGGIFHESVRKVLLGGASALLVTEENIRSALSEVRMPKDAVTFLLQQTDRTRRQLVRLLSQEVRGAMAKVDLRGELRRALVGLNVDVRANIRFREDGDPSPADCQVRSRVRRRRKKPNQAQVAADPARAAGAAQPHAVATAPRDAAPTDATVAAAASPPGHSAEGPPAD